jgi:hypothetical protein
MYLTFIFLGSSDGAYLGSSLHYDVSAMLTSLTGRDRARIHCIALPMEQVPLQGVVIQ